MDFDEFCLEHRVTKAERRMLVIHLAALRAARTIERLS
jgi:hypothetical protein